MGIVGGEELRSMPLQSPQHPPAELADREHRAQHLAASVIAFHQDTLSAVIALAVFLPIISDMSGCSGNQAVAVSMRELTLGIIRAVAKCGASSARKRPSALSMAWCSDYCSAWSRWVWKGNLMLGVVVAVALAANTLIAVCFGGLIPLALPGFGQDPALASGPILTTITDMSGFFIVLTIAGAVLPWLTH